MVFFGTWGSPFKEGVKECRRWHKHKGKKTDKQTDSAARHYSRIDLLLGLKGSLKKLR